MVRNTDTSKCVIGLACNDEVLGHTKDKILAAVSKGQGVVVVQQSRPDLESHAPPDKFNQDSSLIGFQIDYISKSIMVYSRSISAPEQTCKIAEFKLTKMFENGTNFCVIAYI